MYYLYNTHYTLVNMQDRPARSVNFGYSQDNSDQYSPPTEIIIYFGSKVAICVGDEFD